MKETNDYLLGYYGGKFDVAVVNEVICCTKRIDVAGITPVHLSFLFIIEITSYRLLKNKTTPRLDISCAGIVNTFPHLHVKIIQQYERSYKGKEDGSLEKSL